MKKLIIKTSIMAVSALAIITMSGKTVKCSELKPVESIEKFIENHNKAWEAAGYTDGTGKSDPFATSSASSDSLPESTSTPASTEQTPVEINEPPVQEVKPCDHLYTDKITKEATCAEEGEIESRCSKCGDTYKTVIPATGEHSYSSEMTKDPTCTSTGERTYICTVCGDSYSEEIKKVEHDYEEAVTKEASCTTSGEKTFTCIMCGDSYTEEIPATGHVETSPIVTKETGMFTKGEEVVKCEACGEVLETNEIPGRYPVSYLYVFTVLAVLLIALAVFYIIKKKDKEAVLAKSA